MKTRIDSSVNLTADGADHFAGYMRALQFTHRKRALRRIGNGLVTWLAARLQAHQDRVLALRVHRASRVDTLPGTEQKPR